MENNYTFNRLDYIYDLNRNKLTKNRNMKELVREESDSDVEANIRIIPECISFCLAKLKGPSDYKTQIENFEVLKKKFYITNAYINLILCTLSLKYLDIIIRVKYGGMIIAIKSNNYRNNFLIRIFIYFLSIK